MVNPSPPAGTTATRWLTHQEAADYLALDEQTLYQLNSKRRGPAYSKAGRYNRYRAEDLDAWLYANRVTH
jgi:excisionase family DNA binding protein